MDDLEALRQRRLRELQERQAVAQEQAAAAQARQAEEEAAIDAALQQLLDTEALARFTRIRLSRPDFADAVARQLVALAQSGRLQDRITDADLRALLARLAPQDRDIRITRK